MKTITFVHQAGAGEHLTAAMLGAAFGDALRMCEFRVDPGCCQVKPCRRTSEFDRAGYQLLLLKSAESAEPPKTGDLTLVQLREPTLRALGAYAHDIAKRGRQHSIELLQSWLSADALRTVEFRRKWLTAAPRLHALRYEELIDKPGETLDDVLSAAGIHLDETALAYAVGQTEGVSDSATAVSTRALESNPHFVRPLFAEYMNLLAEHCDYLGYSTWTERKPATGPVTTLYRARRAHAEGNFEEVLSVLGPFVAVNAVEPEIRAMLGEALLETGREVEGRRALEAVFKAQPDYFDGHAILARHAYRLGLMTEARGILREAMARRGGAGRVRTFLESTKIDPDFLRAFPEHAEPAISRDAVVAGFTWILGRKPESDVVIEIHRGLHDDDDLRVSLLRSQEFREFHARFEAGDRPRAEPEEPVSREDVLLALRWILGRPLRSRDEASDLLAASSQAELRLRLIGEEEFRQSYGHVAAPA